MTASTGCWRRGAGRTLTVGSNFPYTQFLPELDQARAVQVDRSGKWIGMRYPYELNVVGDAQATLQALIPLLQRKTDRSWREQVEKHVADWWQTVERQAMTDAEPTNPMRMFHELSERMPVNAIIAADSGSAANWYARHPDRPAIAFGGDGAMQMNGLAEMITVAHYYEQWSDRRLIVAVLHNDDLTQVTWEQRGMESMPKFAESQTLPDVDYAAFARGIGLVGINVDTTTEIGPAWDAALAADRPVLLDVRCDPDVPPIPPHASFEQAKSLGAAVLKGDENAGHLVKEGLKQKVQQYLPGTESEGRFTRRRTGSAGSRGRNRCRGRPGTGR